MAATLSAGGIGIGTSAGVWWGQRNPASVSIPAPVTVSKTATPAPTTVTATVAATVKPGRAYGSGTYIVGADILPGTYRSTGPDHDGGTCYWERDNASADPERRVIEISPLTIGESVVVIARTDEMVTFNGCAPFSRVSF